MKNNTFLAAFIFLCLLCYNSSAQTIMTDSLDYSPGETAIITGSGFYPGDTVTLQVLRIDIVPIDTISDCYQPWTVIADAIYMLNGMWTAGNWGRGLGA